MIKMKITYLIAIVISLTGCVQDKSLFYQDSSSKYIVKIKESFDNGVKEDSLYIFNESTKGFKVREFGFYKNGFRNGIWSYNIEMGTATIDWGRYFDKNLHFETTTFLKIDSIKHAYNFSKIEFIVNSEKINLTITINGSVKDSIAKVSYLNVVKKDLIKVGAVLLSPKNYHLINKSRIVYVYKFLVKRKDGQYRYIKSAYTYLNKDFIEFSVVSNKNNSFYANELFDAVLTDFKYKNKSLYNPYFSK